MNMTDDISIILDRCLSRLSQGETIEQCLADYPEQSDILEPLLKTAVSLSAVPKVVPTEEFRKSSHSQLIARLNAEAAEKAHRRWYKFPEFKHVLTARPLIPVSIIILVAVVVGLAAPWLYNTRAYAADYTLSILKGTALVQVPGSTGWSEGRDGTRFRVGSRVETSDNSYAVLTFFDGSTTKLDPGTLVIVDQLEFYEQRMVKIFLQQETGKTWSHVLFDNVERPYFMVQTPQVKAFARGTSFSTEIDASGNTLLTVADGEVWVTGQSKEVVVKTNEQIKLGPEAVNNPVTLPPARDELIISTSPSGIGSVSDPSGASSGYFPNGIGFNQITDSRVFFNDQGQKIEINEPSAGEYIITIRSIEKSKIPVDIQLKKDGRIVFQHSETLQGNTGKGWIIRIKLDTFEGSVINGHVLSVKPLTGKAPESIIETDLAKKRANPIKPDGVKTQDSTSSASSPFITYPEIPIETGTTTGTSTISGTSSAIEPGTTLTTPTATSTSTTRPSVTATSSPDVIQPTGSNITTTTTPTKTTSKPTAVVTDVVNTPTPDINTGVTPTSTTPAPTATPLPTKTVTTTPSINNNSDDTKPTTNTTTTPVKNSPSKPANSNNQTSGNTGNDLQ
jgi:hypothetical protein